MKPEVIIQRNERQERLCSLASWLHAISPDILRSQEPQRHFLTIVHSETAYSAGNLSQLNWLPGEGKAVADEGPPVR